MKIALIGYGKMGHIIEEVARERGHLVVCIIDRDNTQDFDSEAFAAADVAIEFTTPATAEENIRRAWNKGKPVVCGTTGWQVEAFRQAQAEQLEKNALLWSSNFSIGVNILFALNKQLAKIMQRYPQYTPSITEVHHVHKLDAPSGTAKTLAEQIKTSDSPNPLKSTPLRSASGDPAAEGAIGCSGTPAYGGDWGGLDEVGSIPITSIRDGEVAGIHTVQWDSEEDTLSIRHEAKSRKGFALGAVLAAEWLIGKTGFHTMEEVLLDS